MGDPARKLSKSRSKLGHILRIIFLLLLFFVFLCLALFIKGCADNNVAYTNKAYQEANYKIDVDGTEHWVKEYEIKDGLIYFYDTYKKASLIVKPLRFSIVKIKKGD